MLLNVLSQFKWADVFILILAFRICYVAVKSGLPAELFKLLGTLAAVYFSMHYYISAADFIARFVPEKSLLSSFLDFIVFALLAMSAYLVFVLLRNLFCNFLKMEAASNLNKWGGLILGLARVWLLTSLVMFMFAISGISYLNNTVKSSYLGTRVFSLAPDTYAWLWENVVSKFATNEERNKDVSSVENKFVKDK